MGKLVVLKLEGDLAIRGFVVTLEIGGDGLYPDSSTDGFLPPNPELVSLLTDWRTIYSQLASRSRIIRPQAIHYDGSIKPIDQCKQAAQRLEQCFQDWLKSDLIYDVNLQLRRSLNPQDNIRILIRSSDRNLHQLPWQEWNFLDDYPNAEVGIGSTHFYRSPSSSQVRSQSSTVNVLAILGDSENINVEADRQQLKQLPEATIKFLVEPSLQELHNDLSLHSWDILFFAGHSMTGSEGQGTIQLQKQTHITVEQLKFALKEAIARGLQLAIFNSCDGMGLAYALQELQIPQVIVMREPIPDSVAQEFLKHFLHSFARNTSLYLAERYARERLQGLEDQCPCASWLPIIYQHPSVLPLTWQSLRQPQVSSPSQQSVALTPASDESSALKLDPSTDVTLGQPPGKVLLRYLAAIALGSVLIMGMRWLGWLQRWELQTFDQFLRWQPQELPDPRLLIVGATESDLQAYGYPLPDEVLARTLDVIESQQPKAIGLDIFRDQPVPPGYESLGAKLQNHPDLVTVCTLGTENVEGIAPPPASLQSQISFADLMKDQQDKVVRRHLMSHNPSNLLDCNALDSFAMRLLFEYVESSEGRLDIEVTPSQDWKVVEHDRNQSTIFRRLGSRSGGYQNLDARGNQILIRYRATTSIARQVSIQDLLDGQVNADWIRNRIVLVGVVAPSVQDDHLTPIGSLRGLEVHGHMLSQLIAAVEDDRRLIWWLPQRMDLIIVLGAGMVSFGGLYGVLYVTKVSSDLHRGVRILIATSLMAALQYGGGWLLLTQLGLWLPTIPCICITVIVGIAFEIARPDSCSIRTHMQPAKKER